MKTPPLARFLAAALLAPLSNFAQTPPPGSVVGPLDYATKVKPIFEQYCYPCHGNGRSRGGVRLDVRTNAMLHIKPGDSKRSDVYRAITRSIGASDRMPPVTQEQPPAEDINTIKQWIEQGADWLPPVSPRTNVTYAGDIRPIFEKSCFPCHGENLARHNIRLDNIEAVLKGGDDGPVIFPGHADQGPLLLQVTGLGDHDMPPLPSPPPLLSQQHLAGTPPALGPDGLPLPQPLTGQQIGLIRAWLAQGAK